MKRSAPKPAGELRPPAPPAVLVDVLSRLYPAPECALHWSAPHELLVATILSAQCTDIRVNQVTPALFERFPGVTDLAAAPLEELEALIRPTGFFRTKSRHIKACCQALLDRHDGRVPADMGALTCLPGVARKTANVVLGTVFGLADGVVVDTHVRRLAIRLGLSQARQPERVERDLMALIPRSLWVVLSHWLILHGRQVCKARGPACAACALSEICPRRGVT